METYLTADWGCGVGKLTWLLIWDVGRGDLLDSWLGVWETYLTMIGGVGGETYLTGDGGCKAGLSLAEEILESSFRPPLLRKSQLLVLE